MNRVLQAVTSVSARTNALAVLAALLIGGVLVALVADGDNLVAPFEAYAALFRGSLGSVNAVSETLSAATPLVLTGLAVAVPLRAGLFNIGGEGQVVFGGAAAGYVGFALLDVPMLVHVPLALLAGMLAGAVLGAAPGLLKARTGAHEVITTIMFNNIAASLLAAVLLTETFQRQGAMSAISKQVQESSRLPSPEGLRIDAGLLLAVLAAAAVWWLMERSSIGFQIRAVGANAVAAVTAGMSAARTTVLTFAIAGAAAGLGGSVLVLGAAAPGAVTPTFSAGAGFDGITVALLGRGRAWGTVAAGVLFGALRAGGTQMQARTGTPVDLVVVVQALVILFVAAPLVIQTVFRIEVDDSDSGPQVAQGWGA